MDNVIKWVATIIENLDVSIDDNKKKRILEEIAEKNIPTGFIKEIRKFLSTDEEIDAFMDKMCNNWSNIYRQDENIFVMLPVCDCPIEKDSTGKIVSCFCNYCVIWTKELFETVLNMPADIQLESSTLKGDEICRMKIVLSR